MQGPPSNLTPSADDTKPPENNNTPTINILTKAFFIEFLLGVPKLVTTSFHCAFSIPYNPLTLMGFSESGTDFPKMGIWRRGLISCCLLESSQVKAVDLLKSRFGTELRKSFTLSAERL
jgi:hypothetical protein